MSRSPVAYGAYVITRRIARGGMAEIYRARTRSDGAEVRWVALKMMRAALGNEALREQLFKREARIAETLDHPNVVPVYEFGFELDRYFLAMEYVRGRDISYMLRASENAPLEPELALCIGVAAAAGLGHAHQQRDDNGKDLQIVHRDVSPGNVMVTYDGHVKVLDFGVARMNETQGPRTQTGTLRGKFSYMAPEQTLGQPVDARSDVFALGTLLYEMLTGTNPFRTRSPIETLERVQRIRPAPPSRLRKGVSRRVDQILARCLAKDPARRYADCAELEDAIGDFLALGLDARQRRLAGFMDAHFEETRRTEEEELAQEEEEVALIEVVDFDLGVSEGDLDAPNVVNVAGPQEASHAELVRNSSGTIDDSEVGVFDQSHRETVAVALPKEPLLVEAPRPEILEEETGALDIPPEVPTDRPARRREEHMVTEQEVSASAREVEANSLLSQTGARDELEAASVPLSSPRVPVVATRPRWLMRAAVAMILLACGVTAWVTWGLGTGDDAVQITPSPLPTTIEPVTIQVAPGRRRVRTRSAPARRPEVAKKTRNRVEPPARTKSRTKARNKTRVRSTRVARPPAPTVVGTKETARVRRTPFKSGTEKARAVAPSPRSGATGFLNVGARPWAEIQIDGKKWPHQTPQAGIELSVGKHTVVLTNPETGVTKTKVVTIREGAYRTVSVDLRKR